MNILQIFITLRYNVKNEVRYMLKIGKVLAAKLEEKNMTQKDIAKMLNISPGAFSAYVTDTNFPRLDILVEICQILDIDLNHLLNLQNHENMDLLIQGKDEAKVIHFMRSLSHKEREILMESIQSSIRIIEKMKDLKE